MPGSCFDRGANPGGRGMMAPPKDVLPNFEHPASHARELLILNVVCLVVAAVFVSLRMYTRYHLTRRLGYDDGKALRNALACGGLDITDECCSDICCLYGTFICDERFDMEPH